MIWHPEVDRPLAPVAAVVVVLAALLAGAGAVAVSSVLTADWPRVLLAVVLVLAGWWVTRLAHGPAGAALGRPVLRGIGTSFGVLGAYLGGLALLTMTLSATGPPSTIAVILLMYGVPALALLAVAATGLRAWTAGAGAVLPMVAVLLLFEAGVGAGQVSVTMLAVAVVLAVVVVRSPVRSALGDLASAAAAMATSFAFGAGASPFGSLGATQTAGRAPQVTGGELSGVALGVVAGGALLVASVLVIMAVLRHDLAGGFLAASVFVMPPVMMSAVLDPTGAWPTEVVVAVTAVPALAAVVALLAIRVRAVRQALVRIPAALRPPAPESPDAEAPTPSPAARRAAPGTTTRIDPGSETADPTGTADTEAGAGDPASPAAGEAGTGEAADPAGGGAGVGGAVDSAVPRAAGASDPAAAAVDAEADPAADSAAVAATVGAPDGALTVASLAVVVAGAAVAFLVAGMPLFGWGAGPQGVAALLVLVGVGALASWLPGTPGAAAAVIALLGLGLVPPWPALLGGGPSAAMAARVVAGVLTLGSAALLGWFLTRAHRRPGVFAAAAYALAGGLATCVGSMLFNADYLYAGTPPFDTALAPVAVVVLPLVLLGLGAIVAVLRGHLAIGQAVGAVVLAAGAFVPLKVLVGQLLGGTTAQGLPAGYLMQLSLSPLTPTDWANTSAALREPSTPLIISILVMVLIALTLAGSLAPRPSPPLAAAVALTLLVAVQLGLLFALTTRAVEDAQLLGQLLGALGALATVIGLAAGRNATVATRYAMT